MSQDSSGEQVKETMEEGTAIDPAEIDSYCKVAKMCYNTISLWKFRSFQ